jgi:hypothetical protein
MKAAYVNFDVLVDRTPDGLSARVLSSPAGEAAVCFALPAELNAVATSGANWSGEAVHAAGIALFEAVFKGDLLACYRSSRARARNLGQSLRLRFRLGHARDLAWVPWEFLADPERGFLCQFADTTIVRYLELPEAAGSPKLELPLRILAVFSNPEDGIYPPIDVETEWRALQRAVDPLQKAGQVLIEPLYDARLEVLHERLQASRFHVLHFVGHSGLDSTGEEGLVVLEAGNSRSRPVSAGVFRALLADRDLRLVFLNACESARPGGQGLFSGVAQALVQAGVPAVVAMQFRIRDDAASTLAGAFYRGLALSQPVDAAMAEGRKSVVSFGGAEWATPVVFLRRQDGRIFAPPSPGLRERATRVVPGALVTVNQLLLMLAVYHVFFYFVDPLKYVFSFVGLAQVVLALLVHVIPDDWRELMLGPFRAPDGRLRGVTVAASALVSAALLLVAVLARPHVELMRIDGDVRPAFGSPELSIPWLPNVSQRYLCGINPDPDCEEPLPVSGYLRLRYVLGRNRVTSYSIRLTARPQYAVGFAKLRVDRAFEIDSAPDRAEHVDTYGVRIVSPAEARSGVLKGVVELHLVGRILATTHDEEPVLHALFETYRDDKGSFVRSTSAGLCAMVLLSIAALQRSLPAAEQATMPSGSCDCAGVEVNWLSQERRLDATAQAFEEALEASLRAAANWSSVRSSVLKSAEDLTSRSKGDGPAQVVLLTCDLATCPSQMAALSNFEILNARLVARPLYIFISNLKGTAQSGTTVAMAGDVPLPKEEMQHLLSELLNRQVSLHLVRVDEKDLPRVLADALIGETDAVAIFGDEPLPLVDDFRRQFKKTNEELFVLASGFPFASPRELRRASQVEIQYIRLEYPTDTFHRDVTSAPTEPGADSGTVGLAVPTSDTGGPRVALPLVFTNAKSLGRAVPDCCRLALRIAVGDAALATVRFPGPIEGMPISEVRNVLTYALLSSRTGGDPSIDERLRAAALAGYLTATEEVAATISRDLVLGSVGPMDDAEVVESIRQQIGTLPKPKLRPQFAADGPGMVDKGRRGAPATHSSVPAAAWEEVVRLLDMLSAVPTPAKVKPGAGLTCVYRYNPYLELAQVWSRHRQALEPGGPIKGEASSEYEGTRAQVLVVVVRMGVDIVDGTGLPLGPGLSTLPSESRP